MPPLFRLAHISDLHVLDLTGVSPLQFLNKRCTGALNLLGRRRKAHPIQVAEALMARLTGPDLDHVVITGDLTNLALESEFARARQLIDRLGGPARVTVIPGNHDVYLGQTLTNRRFEHWFSEFLADSPQVAQTARTLGRDYYPFVRAPADHIRIYGLSSAVPTPPFFARGEIGTNQLIRLQQLVYAEPAAVTIRIVLVHHNLHKRGYVAERTAQLADRPALAAVLREIRATLVLHGHTHTAHQGHLLGDRGEIVPVIGCGSSTWHRRDHELAKFNLIELTAQGIERVVSHCYRAQTQTYEQEATDLSQRALDPRAAIQV